MRVFGRLPERVIRVDNECESRQCISGNNKAAGIEALRAVAVNPVNRVRALVQCKSGEGNMILF